jgi:filamentous hemagglutinin family protein
VFFFSVLLCPVYMCAAFAVPALFASRAWADVDTVVASIDAYEGGALKAVPSGNSVTVTGVKTNARTPLELDITGVSVVWGATLSGDSRQAVPGNALLVVGGKGNFEVAQNGTIFNETLPRHSAVEVKGDAAFTVKGIVGAAGSNAVAIAARRGTITVEKGGQVRSPRGVAITTIVSKEDRPELSSVALKDKSGITGEVEFVKDGGYISTYYGDVTVDFVIEIDFATSVTEKFPLLVVANGAKLTLTPKARFREGAGMDMAVEKGAALSTVGDMTFNGFLTNEGTISNSGKFANMGIFENKGRFVNTGTLTNVGKLRNDGTIVTTEGKIANEGSIDNTKGKIEGRKNITGKGEIIESNSRHHKHGGCETGLGLTGLAALLGAGILKARRRAA